MQVAVWDTYVQKKDGKTMHFDIIVPDSLKDEARVYHYGKLYLRQKQQDGQALTSRECNFCHIENASEVIQRAIDRHGYYIIELEGCD